MKVRVQNHRCSHDCHSFYWEGSHFAGAFFDPKGGPKCPRLKGLYFSPAGTLTMISHFGGAVSWDFDINDPLDVKTKRGPHGGVPERCPEQAPLGFLAASGTLPPGRSAPHHRAVLVTGEANMGQASSTGVAGQKPRK